MRIDRCVLVACALAPWLATTAPADVVTIQAGRDNTLFQDASGSLSDGAGPVLFAGSNGQGLARRALLWFDAAAALPAGAHIEEVALTLNVSNAPNVTLRTFSLHRVLESWGEGASSTTSGSGAPANDGDATWLHTFWPNQTWAGAGGSFLASPSGSLQVGDVGPYLWTDAGMAADVQSWLEDAAGNHGWLVLGDETTLNTARRFDSRENSTAANRPALMVRYSSTVAVGNGESPSRIALGPCIPNPASGPTRIEFQLARRARARLEVEDPAGRRVTTLVHQWLDAGRHTAVWDGRDGLGGMVRAGIYFCRLDVDGEPVATARVVRLR